MPGSTKWRFVRPSADTPTDTMTDLLYVGQVLRRRSAATSFLRTATGTYCTGDRSGSYLELQQRRSFRPWTNKSSPWRLDNAWEGCDNGHVLQNCWLPLTVNSSRTMFLGILDANCSWSCELTSVRCLSDEQSVAEICGDLAHYPGSEPDHQLRRFYQQHAQCMGNCCPGADRLSTVPVSSILRISFFKPANDHCFTGNIDIRRLAPYSTTL